MKYQLFFSHLGLTLVASILATGPGVCAVHADLAKQTDRVQRQRHQHSSPISSESTPNQPSPELPKETSPSFVAPAPIKPADSQARIGSLVLAIESVAELISLPGPQGLTPPDSFISHTHLHRPVYRANAPPAIRAQA